MLLLLFHNCEKSLFEQKNETSSIFWFCWSQRDFLRFDFNSRWRSLRAALNQSDSHFCSPIRKRSRYIILTISGDTGIMIFGNRNGKAGEKCNRLGSNEYKCQVKQKKKKSFQRFHKSNPRLHLGFESALVLGTKQCLSALVPKH